MNLQHTLNLPAGLQLHNQYPKQFKASQDKAKENVYEFEGPLS